MLQLKRKKENMIEIISKSNDQTKKLAKYLATAIKSGKRSHALVIAFVGELGSGKTTFIQGLAKRLGIREKITSPTFVIFKKFKIPIRVNLNSRSHLCRFVYFYHIDCYRLKADDLLKLGLKDIIFAPQNIVVIEWAEKIKKILPKDTLWIKLKHAGEGLRKIQLCSKP